MFKAHQSASSVFGRTRSSFVIHPTHSSPSVLPTTTTTTTTTTRDSSTSPSPQSFSQPPTGVSIRLLIPPRFKMTTTETAPTITRTNSGEEIREQKPPPGRPMLRFPLGYKAAAYEWWTSLQPALVERNVLSFMPHIKEATSLATVPLADTTSPDPFGNRTWRRSMVMLSGKDRGLNELCVERQGEDVDETLVIVHGYGAGLGFFYKNFEPLSRVPGLRLYALDMLGMGNSTRPPFKIHAKTREDKVAEAENWFIDALEEWRQERKIERFTLLGHSLGGYLAVSYALKYPGHLNKLILASPVGIPEDPYAVSSSLPEPQESSIASEVTDDQQSIVQGNAPSQLRTSTDGNTPAGLKEPPKRRTPSWFHWLWDANISPFSIVRMAGPLGPRFVSGWSSARFNHLPEDERKAMHDYTFSIFKQKGSGEYALAYILAPGAYARRPIINRIQDVGRQPIPGKTQADGVTPLKETGFPIVFMYGEHDWMDMSGGTASQEKLKQARIQALLHASDEEKRAERGDAKVVVVPKAGHHLYIDNADSFNKYVRREVEKTVAEERKRKQLGL